MAQSAQETNLQSNVRTAAVLQVRDLFPFRRDLCSWCLWDLNFLYEKDEAISAFVLFALIFSHCGFPARSLCQIIKGMSATYFILVLCVVFRLLLSILLRTSVETRRKRLFNNCLWMYKTTKYFSCLFFTDGSLFKDYESKKGEMAPWEMICLQYI